MAPLGYHAGLMVKLRTKQDNSEQSARFIAMARELGADGTTADLKRAIRAVAAAPKTARAPLKPRPRSAKRKTP